jgi:hypothetical protein
MGNGKYPQGISTIERILASAVFSNWRDFSPGSLPTVMQLEYQTGPTGSLECLKLWSSTVRPDWKLICEYWMQSSPAHQQGITFTEPNSSSGLTRMLHAIMQHQESFSAVGTLLLDGVVQIAYPQEAQCTAAKRHMMEALQRITSRESPVTVNMAMRFAADHLAMPASGCGLLTN